MEKKQVLRGLATVNFYATNHEAAKKWYSDFLGIEPYFNVPGYTEFRIGDYQQELGIIDGNMHRQDIRLNQLELSYIGMWTI